MGAGVAGRIRGDLKDVAPSDHSGRLIPVGDVPGRQQGPVGAAKGGRGGKGGVLSLCMAVVV